MYLRTIALTMLVAATVAAAEPSLVTISSGIITKRIERSLLYDSTIPVLFDVPLPKLLHPTPPNTPCNSNNYLCKLSTATYQTLKIINEELSQNPLFHGTNATSMRRGLFNFVGRVHSFLYGTATEDDLIKIEKQLSKVEQNEKDLASRIIGMDERGVQLERNFSIYTAQLHTYLLNERNNFARQIEAGYKSNVRNEAELAYSINNVNTGLYVSNSLHLIESAAADCRVGKFPIILIGPSLLSAQLSALKKKLSVYKYEIVGSSNQLLQNALTQCTFTKTHLTVTLHVPIKIAERRYELYQVIPTPFKHFTDICRVANPTDFFIKTPSTVIPFNAVDDLCDTKKFLCRVPSGTHRFYDFSQCASVLAQNFTSDNIISHCTLECKKSDAKFKTEIGEHHMALTNYRKVTYNCSNSIKIIDLHSEVGSNLVKLPCNCKITIDDEVIRPEFGCHPSGFELAHEYTTVIPAAWSIPRSLLINLDQSSYTNMSEIVNPNWMFEVPYLNITPRVVLPIHLRKIAASLPFVGDFEVKDNYLIIWLVVLTIVTGCMIFSACCPYKPGSGFAKYVPFLPGVMAQGKDESNFAIFWGKLTSIQWEEAGLSLVTILFILLVLMLILRVLKMLKKSARYMEAHL